MNGIRRTVLGAAIAAVAMGTLALSTAGCGGPESVDDAPEGSLGDDSVRYRCDPEGREVRAVDVNNDGEPDIRHVFEDGRESCAQYDMNFDGRVDVTRFFGPDGTTPIQEEHDFDFDGRIDMLSYFENGALIRKELDTNFDNRIDTWVWCAGRLYARQERDRHHTGRVDTWEFFDGGILREARYDDNNDGTPERWEMFREGRLFEIRRDTNLDGDVDQTEEIPTEGAGEAETALTCDGAAPPEVRRPTPPPATSGGETEDERDLAEPDDEGTPWEGVSDVPPEDDLEGDEDDSDADAADQEQP